MASERQIQANRKNAQLSCGPKTVGGKTTSSQNALKHGLLSQQIVIEGEALSEYEKLHSNLIDGLCPVGELERLLVNKIATYSWRLRRFIHAESKMLERGAQSIHNHKTLDSYFEGFSAKKMTAMTRYESSISRHFYRAVRQLQELQELRYRREEDEFGFVSK